MGLVTHNREDVSLVGSPIPGEVVPQPVCVGVDSRLRGPDAPMRVIQFRLSGSVGLGIPLKAFREQLFPPIQDWEAKDLLSPTQTSSIIIAVRSGAVFFSG